MIYISDDLQFVSSSTILMSNLRHVAEVIIKNFIQTPNEPHCVVYMACGSALNEIKLSLEFRNHGLLIEEEFFMDKISDANTIQNLINHHKNTYSHVYFTCNLNKLTCYLTNRNKHLLVLGINSAFYFDNMDEFNSFQSFFKTCHEWSKESRCSSHWINVLETSNTFPVADMDNKNTYIYSCPWLQHAMKVKYNQTHAD